MSKGKHRKPDYEQTFYNQVPMAVPLAPQVAYPYEPKPVVSVEVLGAKNATVAKVTLAKHTDWTAAGTTYKFEAAEASKREQGDVHDAVTGEMLAVARALQRISRQMFSEANKRVRDSVAEQEKATAAAEAKKEAAKSGPPPQRTKEAWLKELHKRYTDDGGVMDFITWARETGQDITGLPLAQGGVIAPNRSSYSFYGYDPYRYVFRGGIIP